MDIKKLTETTQQLFSNDKGLLAMDESTPSCNKRFANFGIAQTPEMRRDYREMIITAPGLSESVSGVILYDETIRQMLKNGAAFPQAVINAGIIPGIKVDEGLEDFEGHPQEKVTKGLDGLPERLKEYFAMGAKFAKWRAAFSIGEGTPSNDAVKANADLLAKYALACQEAGIVPMVEPEVLMDGTHTMEECREVTTKVLKVVFESLTEHNVALEGVILKPNMVVPGLDCPTQNSVEEVAEATVETLLKEVPTDIAGVAFLSGGQSGELASARLNAMNKNFKEKLPWPLTFSFSRAIQYPALEIWHGEEANVVAAQKSLLHRAACNRAARRGEYTEAMEV